MAESTLKQQLYDKVYDLRRAEERLMRVRIALERARADEAEATAAVSAVQAEFDAIVDKVREAVGHSGTRWRP